MPITHLLPNAPTSANRKKANKIEPKKMNAKKAGRILFAVLCCVRRLMIQSVLIFSEKMMSSGHFSANHRSLRRTPHLPRPTVFPGHHFPSYNGGGGGRGTMFGSFGTLPRRAVSQMGSAPVVLHHHIQYQQEPQQQQPHQPYCTVEEIKQGKRQNGGGKSGGRNSAEEQNHYDYDVEEPDDDDDEEEDDDYGLYEKAPKSRPNSLDLKLQQSQQTQKPPPLPPPLPPPPIPFNKNVGWKRSPKEGKEMFKQQRCSHTKILLVLLLLLLLSSLLLALPLLLLWLSTPTAEGQFPPAHRPPISISNPSAVPSSLLTVGGDGSSREVIVEAEKLAQWMADKQSQPRLRLFEVRDSNRQLKEEAESPSSALPRARPLQLASLSHNGVPVHPLQFQRLLRAQGVDADSLVVLYDRHPLGLLAAYALWVFRLYGHEASFVLNGGLSGWHQGNWSHLSLSSESEEDAERRPGTFRAEWRQQYIATFDDLLVNFESSSHGSPQADVADAQSPQEYDGKPPPGSSAELAASATIFGHIRTSVNLPVERLFTYHHHQQQGKWNSVAEQSRVFAASGLSPRRPVIVYDGASSLRAAALWAALHRANFSASVYFGAWPEWLIRAPDHLKIIPDK